MFINIGLGCFLVSIGATPVTMLPPIMIAIGYSSLAVSTCFQEFKEFFNQELVVLIVPHAYF